MFDVNQTNLVEFLLLGFQTPQMFNSVFFLLLLVIYILTLVGNLLIIILVVKFQSLQSPMYIFLTQLSMCDIILTTNISPNLLHVIINGGSTISVAGCITQFYFYCLSEGTECFLLTVMSYDRYLAICRPLRYSSIMGFRLYFQLILLSWFLACIIAFILASLVSILRFCNCVVDHYFCDLSPVTEMSCTKHTVVELVDFVIAIPSAFFPSSFIIFTYVSIFIAILKITSSTGRQKAFSTCSSHITVVSAYYRAVITVYIAPSKWQSFNIKKVASLLITVFCPIANSFIYSLRNQDIKQHLKMFLSNSIVGISNV